MGVGGKVGQGGDRRGGLAVNHGDRPWEGRERRGGLGGAEETGPWGPKQEGKE